MEEKQVKKTLKKINKINFFHLFKIFRWRIVIYWLTSLVIAIISYIISFTARQLMTSGTEDVKNYARRILPIFFRRIFVNAWWTKEDFLLFSAILIISLVFLLYFSNLQKEKFQIEAEDYVKNALLDKFRFLPFEEREQRKKEINILVEKDSAIVGKFWNNLYNNIFKLSITLFLIIFSFRYYDSTKLINRETIFVSLVWIFLVNLIGFFLLQKILRNERKRKKELTKENALINKESNNSILIDSMGLTSQYRDKQRLKTKKKQNLFKSFSPFSSLYGIFSEEIINFYPFIVFIFVKEIPHTSLFVFYNLFDTFSKSFKLLIDYGDYSSSLARINNFLALPQKNDNLTGLIITSKINSIVFKNVSFKYSNKGSQTLKNHDDDFTKKNVSYLLGESTTDKSTILYFKYATGENWILEDYNHNFTTKNINELSGENGTGKSTILYLLLGMLRPTNGQVLINCQGGKIYDLHKDINLKHWREQTVAYCAHDTLIEVGSTGQKQLTNVEQVIAKKKAAQIFLFDEADNALDKKNQEEFEEKLKNLSKKNKLIIYTIKV